MATTDTKYGSKIMANITASPVSIVNSRLAGGKVHSWVDTVETSADAVSGSTYTLARLPSNAVILSQSMVYWDDLATTGSPTVDIGVFNVGDETGITDDDDALNDGLDVSSAGSDGLLKTEVSDVGKELWEHVASQTTDPQKLLDIKATLKDAAVTNAATIAVEIFYAVD